MAPTFTSNRQKKIWEKQRKDLEEKKKNAKTYVNQTPFRYMERNFKSIVPPPDFSQVVDFSKGINFAEQGVTAVSLSQDLKQLSPLFGDPANDNEPCTNDDPSAAQAYIIKSVPGLIIIPQAFTPKAQRHLIKECLRNYPRAPNTSNLHTHYHVPEEGIWPLFEKQVKGTLKPSDPQFYVAKKAVVDSEDDHHDDDTSSDDEHEHDKTNNNNNNNTCAMNAPTACSDDFKPIIDGPKPDPLPAPGVPLLPPSVLVRKIRWITLGYQYHWPTKTYHLDRRYPFPPEIAEITKAVVTACENVGGKKEDGTDEWRNTYKGSDFEAEAGVVNYYQFRDTLMGHVDRSELNMDAPLVSISLGHDCIYVIGGPTRDTVPVPLLLRSGDMVVMTGPSRKAFHGVPLIIENTLPPYLSNQQSYDDAPDWKLYGDYMSTARINLNVRQVNPPEKSVV